MAGADPRSGVHRCVGWLVALLMSTTLLQACGGGGGVVPLPIPGQPSNPQVSGRVSASFTPAVASAEAVARQSTAPQASVQAQLDYTGNRDIFIAVREDNNLLQDYGVVIDGRTLHLTLPFNAQRPAGIYDSELLVLACFDRDCREAVPGSPLRLPVRLEVTPNIEVAPTVALSRSGREPAPTLIIPITVPAGAGQLQPVAASSFGEGIQVELVNNSYLSVTTLQLQAATYKRQVFLASATDPRYQGSVDITYTVHPPAGGQLALSMTPTGGSEVIEQGQRHSARFRVQRPTWTDTFSGPVVSGDGQQHVVVQALGGDEYQIDFDAAGLPVGSVRKIEVAFNAGPHGGGVSGGWSYWINDAFSVGAGLTTTLDADSLPSALRLSAPVTTASGPPARWTARSLSPAVTLLRSSGTTGVDPIELEFDRDTALAAKGVASGEIEVSVDRPGTLTATVGVAVGNQVPMVGPALRGAVVGSSGSVFVDGNLRTHNGWDSLLQVSGATVRQARLVEDTRFVGEVTVLRIDFEGAVPGRDIVLSMATPLRTTQVTLPVRAAPQVAAGYAALPLRVWRSPRFGLAHDALYFAADGTLARWTLSGGQWTLATAAVTGLVDAALYGNESFLLGAGGTTAWRIDPSSLAVTASQSLADVPFIGSVPFEPAPPGAMSVLAIAADGATQAALRYAGSDPGSGGVKGIGGAVATLTASVANGTDPGATMEALEAGDDRRAGVVRSPSGAVVVGQQPSGRLRIYDTAQRRPTFGETLPSGTHLHAVSDDGLWSVRSDGVLHRRGLALSGSLALHLPAGFVAGGYGLSGRGRHALVYGYRIADEAGTPRARDAALWVIDIREVENSGVAAAPIVERVLLADAVGCTQALQSGETCQHTAAIAVAEGDASAFVLGPRGVAAVPLPAVVSSLSAGPVSRRVRQATPVGQMSGHR